MAGLPVSIRLLDPPLHEFLPHPDELEGAERDRAEALRETNPMLGTRGCRLHIIYPEIPRMQVRAIVKAAAAVRERRRRPARGDHGPAGRLRERARRCCASSSRRRPGTG